MNKKSPCDLYVALDKANLPNAFKNVVLQRKAPPKEYLAEKGIAGSEPIAKGWAFWAFNGTDYEVVWFYTSSQWQKYNEVVEYTGSFPVGAQISEVQTI